MNTETGEFVDERLAEAWMERIAKGEVVQIKGKESADLEVVKITKREVTLKLLSRAERYAKLLEEPVNRHQRRAMDAELRKLKGTIREGTREGTAPTPPEEEETDG